MGFLMAIWDPILVTRRFFVKWWDNLNNTDLLTKSVKNFHAKGSQSQGHSHSHLPPLLSVEGMMRTELKEMARQLFAQASQMGQLERASPTSFEASTSSQTTNPYASSLFQDSQNSFADLVEH